MKEEISSLSHHNDEIVAKTDLVLSEPPVDIHTALTQAVEAGRMTQEEAKDCYEAYMGVFNK